MLDLSTENIYVLLVIAEYVLEIFQFVFILLFITISLLKIINVDDESLDMEIYIKELLSGIILVSVLFLYTNIEFNNLLVFWVLSLGIIIGSMQSKSITIHKYQSDYKIVGRKFFFLVFLFFNLFLFYCLLFQVDLINMSVIGVFFAVSLLIGIDLSLILRIRAFEKMAGDNNK